MCSTILISIYLFFHLLFVGFDGDSFYGLFMSVLGVVWFIILPVYGVLKFLSSIIR